VRVESSNKHQTRIEQLVFAFTDERFLSLSYLPLVHNLLDLFFVSLDTNNAVLLERNAGIRQQTNRLKKVLDHDGLENIKL
jgi:hypothetical protein